MVALSLITTALAAPAPDAPREERGTDPRRALVVEHRVFAGLSTADTAQLMGISTATVERDWRAARAWLTAQLTRGTSGAALLE